MILGLYLIMGIFWTWWMFDFKKELIKETLNGSSEWVQKATYVVSFIFIVLVWPPILFDTVIKSIKKKKRD